MIWLQPPPYGRWALALLIAAGALWVEFKPDTTVELPFAAGPIASGQVVDSANTEMRRVPVGLLHGAELGDVATRAIPAGDPVLSRDVTEPSTAMPKDWWVVSVSLPPSAEVGDDVRLVVLDSGESVPGVVAAVGADDPFAAADGGVAVPSEQSAKVAMAASAGRLAVLLSTG